MAAVPSLGRATGVEAPRPAEDAVAGELYARYSERIYRYCLSRLRSREEAEDATQTTFLNAFRGLQRGVTPELEQAWLYKIAENVCLTRVRTNTRRRRVEAPTDLEPLHDSVAAPQRDRDELHGISDALAALPEQQRRAILLREWQGLSYREIAAELGISQGAVETLIFRARRSLARQLERNKSRTGLRRSMNVGSLLAWLKSIALGGSTAAKVAAVVAAGSAVIAAGSDRTAHRQAVPVKRPTSQRVVLPAVAAIHVRPPMIRMRASSSRAAAPTRHPKPRPVANSTAPERRAWAQRVPTEADETSAPAARPTESTEGSAPPVTKPEPSHEKTEPAETKEPPAAKKPEEPETAPESRPERPSLPPTANENAADHPSGNAPEQPKDKPKKG
jgi:RNA polymerase sigma factor (sigma-70 family)